MGISELSVFLILAALIVVPAYLPFYYRRKRPEQLWLGIVLSFVSGTAQFYLPEKALRYFLLCALFLLIMKGLVGATWIAWVLADVFQAGVMYYRFLKLQGPQISKARV